MGGRPSKRRETQTQEQAGHFLQCIVHRITAARYLSSHTVRKLTLKFVNET